MRNMLLSLVIVAAVGAGACGGGEDDESSSQATAVGNENSAAIDSSATAPTSGDNVAQAAESLPSTASPLPAIGAIGILFLGAATGVRRRRQFEYQRSIPGSSTWEPIMLRLARREVQKKFQQM